jgi:hypothetical protein
MGNNFQNGRSPNQLQSFTFELNHSYFFINELKDPRFGDIQVYKFKTLEKFIFAKAIWSKNMTDHIRLMYPIYIKYEQ